MNPLETFGEFSKRLNTTDLMLYAGIGVVLWVLFKDKLSPVQKLLSDLLGRTSSVVKPIVVSPVTETTADINKDVFFDLVVSWKQTRDLAVRSGCSKAVEVADQMFPYLSPVICNQGDKDDKTKA